MSNKVYIVTSGEYSDYRINAVFSTREKAQEFLDICNQNQRDLIGSSAEIEEWDLDIPRETWLSTHIYMFSNGDVSSAYTYLTARGNSAPSFGGFAYSMPKSGERLLSWTVRTGDKERAIKMVNEKRALILSHNLWADEEGVRRLLDNA